MKHNFGEIITLESLVPKWLSTICKYNTRKAYAYSMLNTLRKFSDIFPNSVDEFKEDEERITNLFFERVRLLDRHYTTKTQRLMAYLSFTRFLEVESRGIFRSTRIPIKEYLSEYGE